MYFSGTIQHILHCILTENPTLGSVYLRKVYLEDVCIYLWFHLEDLPSVELLLPKWNTYGLQLVGLHISLPMGFINSAPLFCMETETVSEFSHHGY